MIIGILNTKVSVKKDTSFTLNDSVHIQGLINSTAVTSATDDVLAILVPHKYGDTFKVSVAGTQVTATWDDEQGTYVIKAALTAEDMIVSADVQQA
jgi:hypothetical protein|nr:MAG TPA_asm: hypothetical protein [Caudoviricetes sp.]